MPSDPQQSAETSDARQWLHDRIGGLCCRYMTLVAPLSGGTVEQAYRLRDDIMALLDSQLRPTQSDGSEGSADDHA